jgi:hypothetical protein
MDSSRRISTRESALCAAVVEIPEYREKMSPAVPAKVAWINPRRFFTISSRV